MISDTIMPEEPALRRSHMPRFSLMHLLMGTLAATFLLVLIQAVGCGARFSRIENLSFSSDASRILVTKLTARDAQTPGKGYKANVARTISWIDSSSGIGQGIVHQDFVPGNAGPAFRYWRRGRTSVVCNPRNDQVTFSAFGGGDLTYVANQAAVRKTIPLTQPASNLALSRSGRLLAASGADYLTILDTSTNNIIMQTQTGDMAFLGVLLMCFSSDESRLITVGDHVACIWDTSTSSHVATFAIEPKSSVRAIAGMPDGSFVFCSDTWIKRYDPSGTLLNAINDRGGDVCVASQATNTLVFSDGDKITLCEATNGKIIRTVPYSGATSLALSSDDEWLAIGGSNGRVAMYNLSRDDRHWSANPPQRHRLSWTIPAVALCAWCWIAYRFANCSSRPLS